jgi:hypothetical protein
VVWDLSPVSLSLARASGSWLPVLLLGCSGSRSSGPVATFAYRFGPILRPVLLRPGLSRSSPLSRESPLGRDGRAPRTHTPSPRLLHRRTAPLPSPPLTGAQHRFHPSPTPGQEVPQPPSHGPQHTGHSLLATHLYLLHSCAACQCQFLASLAPISRLVVYMVRYQHNFFTSPSAKCYRAFCCTCPSFRRCPTAACDWATCYRATHYHTTSCAYIIDNPALTAPTSGLPTQAELPHSLSNTMIPQCHPLVLRYRPLVSLL